MDWFDRIAFLFSNILSPKNYDTLRKSILEKKKLTSGRPLYGHSSKANTAYTCIASGALELIRTNKCLSMYMVKSLTYTWNFYETLNHIIERQPEWFVYIYSASQTIQNNRNIINRHNTPLTRQRLNTPFDQTNQLKWIRANTWNINTLSGGSVCSLISLVAAAKCGVGSGCPARDRRDKPLYFHFDLMRDAPRLAITFQGIEILCAAVPNV